MQSRSELVKDFFALSDNTQGSFIYWPAVGVTALFLMP